MVCNSGLAHISRHGEDFWAESAILIDDPKNDSDPGEAIDGEPHPFAIAFQTVGLHSFALEAKNHRI